MLHYGESPKKPLWLESSSTFKATKLLLIQTTTSAILYYSMQVMKILGIVIEELERTNRCFFLGEEFGQRSYIQWLGTLFADREKARGLG